MNIGDKLFNDDGDVVRITNIRNKNLYIAKSETTGELGIKLRTKDIQQYKLIKPIGFVTFMTANIGGGHKDVIVTLHRIIDMNKHIYKPFIGARLSMINMFAMPFENDIEHIPLGMRYSIDTCPTNVNFDIIYQCEKILDKDVISVYLDDNLQSITPLILNKDKYDLIIQRFKNRFDKAGVKNTGKTIYEFLDLNGFMSEFDHAFNILNLNHKDSFDTVPDRDIILKLESKIGYKVFVDSIIEYTYNVNLSRLDPTRFIILKTNEYDNHLHVMKYERGDKVLIVQNNDEKLFAQQLVSMNK